MTGTAVGSTMLQWIRAGRAMAWAGPWWMRPACGCGNGQCPRCSSWSAAKTLASSISMNPWALKTSRSLSWAGVWTSLRQEPQKNEGGDAIVPAFVSSFLNFLQHYGAGLGFKGYRHDARSAIRSFILHGD